MGTTRYGRNILLMQYIHLANTVSLHYCVLGSFRTGLISRARTAGPNHPMDIRYYTELTPSICNGGWFHTAAELGLVQLGLTKLKKQYSLSSAFPGQTHDSGVKKKKKNRERGVGK